jgi:hypothetical protein
VALLVRLLVVAGLLCALLPKPALAQSGYTVGSCASIDEEQLREEIEAAALAAMQAVGATDIESMVARKWAELDVDSAIDAAVADAAAGLQDRESYLSRLLSGWSAERAEEYAEIVARTAFASDTFNDKIDELSSAIGEEIATAVNSQLALGASAAFLCLRDYVGEEYTDTLFAVFERSVTATVSEADVQLDGGTLGLSALDTHSIGLVGAGIIIVAEVGRRVSLKLGEKVAQRVAGKVVGRVAGRAGASIIPAVGWIVGVGLIVYDLVEGGRGALPQIEQALTSAEVKDRIRADVVDAVRVGIPEESSIAALETAVTMIERWDAFCTTYDDVCSLAQEDPSFARLLADADVLQMERLEALVDLFLASFGRDALTTAVQTGAFDELLALPAAGMTILRESRSVEQTLAWAEQVGPGRLDAVSLLGLHMLVAPESLSATLVDRLLGVGNRALVETLVQLDATTLEALLELPPAVMQSLVTSLSAEELARFVQVQRLPAITATPPALVAQAVVSGVVSLEQLEATATPVPPTSPATAAVAGSAAEGGGAGAGSTPASGDATADGATPASTAVAGTPAAPAVPSADVNRIWLAGGLLLLVMLLAVALYWSFARRSGHRPPSQD